APVSLRSTRGARSAGAPLEPASGCSRLAPLAILVWGFAPSPTPALRSRCARRGAPAPLGPRWSPLQGARGLRRSPFWFGASPHAPPLRSGLAALDAGRPLRWGPAAARFVPRSPPRFEHGDEQGGPRPREAGAAARAQRETGAGRGGVWGKAPSSTMSP